MLSVETIRHLARQAALAAAAAEIEPYNPASPEECLSWQRLPIPNIGDYRPAGWRLVDIAFVDSSGYGDEDEAAMTIRRFKEWCADIVARDPQAGFAVIESGQFQVYVGYFTTDPYIETDDDDLGLEINPDDVFYCEACGEYTFLNGSGVCENCDAPLFGEEDE